MPDDPRFWIGVSNREESMARVLSRAQLHEGAVLHAQRAASAALAAVLARAGLPHRSSHCSELCAAVEAAHFAPPDAVKEAAHRLDSCSGGLEPDPTGAPPDALCTADIVAACLDALKCIRQFVNAALSD